MPNSVSVCISFHNNMVVVVVVVFPAGILLVSFFPVSFFKKVTRTHKL